MFGIGMPEMILILAIALIVIGPKKLPDLAKSLGRALREFKKATTEFKETMELDNDFKEVKRAFNDINDDIKGSLAVPTAKDDDGQPGGIAPETEKNESDNKFLKEKTAAEVLNNNETRDEIPEEEVDVQAGAEIPQADRKSETDVKQNGGKGSLKNG